MSTKEGNSMHSQSTSNIAMESLEATAAAFDELAEMIKVKPTPVRVPGEPRNVVVEGVESGGRSELLYV